MPTLTTWWSDIDAERANRLRPPRYRPEAPAKERLRSGRWNFRPATLKTCGDNSGATHGILYQAEGAEAVSGPGPGIWGGSPWPFTPARPPIAPRFIESTAEDGTTIMDPFSFR